MEEQPEPCKSVCEESLSDKSDDTEMSASSQTLVKGYDQPFNLDNDLSFTFKEGIVYDGFFTEETFASVFDGIIE